MAARSIDGKSWSASRILDLLSPRWGVKGSLFAAFAVIAGMAIVISAGAGMVLGHLGGTMIYLSGRDIPRLAASLQLAAESASLASQGPDLLASRTQETLDERSRKMKEPSRSRRRSSARSLNSAPTRRLSRRSARP